ncbi:MAG: hypothetical protein OXI56_11560, partial [bacterium]|nr:hypothetical protein [bacterium]MDE0602419.1 hypothetical protein [bacterium]
RVRNFGDRLWGISMIAIIVRSFVDVMENTPSERPAIPGQTDDESIGQQTSPRGSSSRQWQRLGRWRGARFGFFLALVASTLFWSFAVFDFPSWLTWVLLVASPILGLWSFVICWWARSKKRSWAWTGLWVAVWGCLCWWLLGLILVLVPSAGDTLDALDRQVQNLYQAVAAAGGRGAGAVLVIAGAVGGAAIVALGLVTEKTSRLSLPPEQSAQLPVRTEIVEFLQFVIHTAAGALFCGLAVSVVPPNYPVLLGLFGFFAILTASLLCPLLWLIATAMPNMLANNTDDPSQS